nr:MAG TPA: hypothetical protein [Caudoviricetes sp.]
MSNLLKPLINRDLERIQKYQKNTLLQRKSGINLLIPLFVK